MAQKLNDQQRKALRLVASGLTLTEAGRQAGYSISNAPQMVSRLMKRPDAQEFLTVLRDKADDAVILSVKGRREHLSRIATSQCATPGEQMAAIHLLNKMDCLYVTKVEADVTHKGGVMIVPMAGSVEEWQKQAASSQARLMEEARQGDA